MLSSKDVFIACGLAAATAVIASIILLFSGQYRLASVAAIAGIGLPLFLVIMVCIADRFADWPNYKKRKKSE
jgi:hypothetical protein